MSRKLATLMNAHKGQYIWVCGSGPSLDAVDADDIRGPRIYLNRVAFAMPREPGVTYWIVVDDCWHNGTPGPWDEYLSMLRDGSAQMRGVFRNPLLAGKGYSPAPDCGPNTIHWGPGDRTKLLRMTREEVAEADALFLYTGTAGTAIHLAWFMGAKGIIVAGLDGSDGYASRLSQFYDKPGRGGLGYQPALESALDVCKTLGLENLTYGEWKERDAEIQRQRKARMGDRHQHRHGQESGGRDWAKALVDGGDHGPYRDP